MRAEPRILTRELREQKAAARDLDITEAPSLTADLVKSIKEAAEKAPAVLVERVAGATEGGVLDAVPPVGGQVAGSPKNVDLTPLDSKAQEKVGKAAGNAVATVAAEPEEDSELLMMASSRSGDVVDVSTDPSEDEDGWTSYVSSEGENASAYYISPEDKAAGWVW